VIVGCIKIAYFYDNNNVLHAPEPKTLENFKKEMQDSMLISVFLPYIVGISVEYFTLRKIIRNKKVFHTLMIASAILYLGLISLWITPEG
jgi:hypothetical protein